MVREGWGGGVVSVVAPAGFTTSMEACFSRQDEDESRPQTQREVRVSRRSTVVIASAKPFIRSLHLVSGDGASPRLRPGLGSLFALMPSEERGLIGIACSCTDVDFLIVIVVRDR